MSKDGLAVAPQGTTTAPDSHIGDLEIQNKLLVEKLAKFMAAEEAAEVTEDVAKGHVKVVEIIAYDFDKMVDVIDGLTDLPTGKKKRLEKSRGPFFCQTKEQELIFKQNNPGARIETFGIQLLKSTARKYLDKPENMKAFEEAE